MELDALLRFLRLSLLLFVCVPFMYLKLFTIFALSIRRTTQNSDTSLITHVRGRIGTSPSYERSLREIFLGLDAAALRAAKHGACDEADARCQRVRAEEDEEACAVGSVAEQIRCDGSQQSSRAAASTFRAHRRHVNSNRDSHTHGHTQLPRRLCGHGSTDAGRTMRR